MKTGNLLLVDVMKYMSLMILMSPSVHLEQFLPYVPLPSAVHITSSQHSENINGKFPK